MIQAICVVAGIVIAYFVLSMLVFWAIEVIEENLRKSKRKGK